MNYKQKQFEAVLEAKLAALRFIERADTALNAISEDDYGKGKHIGAMKRASMDLTRSLVGCRKSPYSND